MGYTFVEGLTVADVAFHASGKTLNELFEQAALATFDVNVNLKTVKHNKTSKIKLSAQSMEQLLFKFLDELILIKDRDYRVFSTFKVEVKEKKGKYFLQATAWGDAINPKTQELRVDVKAVTMHNFELKKEKSLWKCQVILDI